MRPNALRDALRSGRPTFGTAMESFSPSEVEVLGLTGVLDYVEFNSEDAQFDLTGLDHFCRAAELHNLTPMIRVDQEPRRFLVQHAIGAGFQSIVFADVRSAVDARACVAAVRPDVPGGGSFGVVGLRNTYLGQSGSPAFVQALNEIVVILMIEKSSAVEQLDEILAVPGVDMVQWGPGDYAMSVGRPGEWRHPDLLGVERLVYETTLRAGVAARAEVNQPEDAARFLELGVRHFSIGTDSYILFDWIKRNVGVLRSMVEAGGPR